MKNHIKSVVAVLIIALTLPTLSGCGSVGKILSLVNKGGNNITVPEDDSEKAEEKSEKKKKNKKKKKSEKTEDVEEADPYLCDADEVFADMADWLFIFSSGAGGWATELNVNADGSFSGKYYDSDMGDTGEGYPDGTCYECNFTGHFSDKVRNFAPLMYGLTISDMDLKQEPDTVEIKDNIRYVYSTPYGLEDLVGKEEYLCYMMAGAVTSAINKDELSWFPRFGSYVGSDFEYVEDIPETLPYAALINTKNDYSFYSENKSQKNKTYLANTVKVPGLTNTTSDIYDDGTYYFVDENSDGTFRIINTCFGTNRKYDPYLDADSLVKEALGKVYGKSAPSSDDLVITSPKDATEMSYEYMMVNGVYSDYAVWYPNGWNSDIFCNARIVYLDGHETGGSFIYAYIIESSNKHDGKSFPDSMFADYYIASLELTGRDDRISSSGEGDGAVRALTCTMKSPGRSTVLAKETLMITQQDKDLIKKYHLEDSEFLDDYEIICPDDIFKEYDLADSYVPFYVEYPEDNYHTLFHAYDFDKYSGKNGNKDSWEGLMTLYLDKNDKVLYGQEIYTP